MANNKNLPEGNYEQKPKFVVSEEDWLQIQTTRVKEKVISDLKVTAGIIGSLFVLIGTVFGIKYNIEINKVMDNTNKLSNNIKTLQAKHEKRTDSLNNEIDKKAEKLDYLADSKKQEFDYLVDSKRQEFEHISELSKRIIGENENYVSELLKNYLANTELLINEVGSVEQIKREYANNIENAKEQYKTIQNLNKETKTTINSVSNYGEKLKGRLDSTLEVRQNDLLKFKNTFNSETIMLSSRSKDHFSNLAKCRIKYFGLKDTNTLYIKLVDYKSEKEILRKRPIYVGEPVHFKDIDGNVFKIELQKLHRRASIIPDIAVITIEKVGDYDSSKMEEITSSK